MTLPLTAPDLDCYDDLDLFGAETTSDLQTLEQDVYHLLIETPGSNLDDLNRGIGIEEMLSGPDIQLTDVARRIEAELQKDDRIDAAEAVVTKVDSGSYRLEVTITASTDVLGVSYSFTQAGGLIPL